MGNVRADEVDDTPEPAIPSSGIRPGFVLDGLTVMEVSMLCFRSRKRIYALIYQHDMLVKRIWVPVKGCGRLQRQILLLPPATVDHIRRLTRDRVRYPKSAAR